MGEGRGGEERRGGNERKRRSKANSWKKMMPFLGQREKRREGTDKIAKKTAARKVIEVGDAKGRKDMGEKRPLLSLSLLCTRVGLGKKEVAMSKKSVRLSVGRLVGRSVGGITKEAATNKRTPD